MPRPRLCRRIYFEPDVTYFKPAGIRLFELNEVILTKDELEAVRLKDFENIDQKKAAKKMNISQPTFHRLLLSARKKIADALTNGKAIKIEGGNYKIVRPRISRGFGGPAVTCKCPKCGYEEPKVRGIRCIDRKCPKCNTLMVRGQ